MSVTLFHGPGTRGRFASPDQGPLRVEGARKVCADAQFAGSMGWVLGPLDDATKDALDALLKLLEEHEAAKFWTLWAIDLGLVPPTIRSRVDEIVFLPLPEGEQEFSQAMVDLAFGVARASLGKDVAFLFQKIHGLEAEQLPEFLGALEHALVVLPGGIQLWPHLRDLCGQITRPAPWQVFSALCFT